MSGAFTWCFCSTDVTQTVCCFSLGWQSILCVCVTACRLVSHTLGPRRRLCVCMCAQYVQHVACTLYSWPIGMCVCVCENLYGHLCVFKWAKSLAARLWWVTAPQRGRDEGGETERREKSQCTREKRDERKRNRWIEVETERQTEEYAAASGGGENRRKL